MTNFLKIILEIRDCHFLIFLSLFFNFTKFLSKFNFCPQFSLFTFYFTFWLFLYKHKVVISYDKVHNSHQHHYLFYSDLHFLSNFPFPRVLATMKREKKINFLNYEEEKKLFSKCFARFHFLSLNDSISFFSFSHDSRENCRVACNNKKCRNSKKCKRIFKRTQKKNFSISFQLSSSHDLHQGKFLLIKSPSKCCMKMSRGKLSTQFNFSILWLSVNDL